MPRSNLAIKRTPKFAAIALAGLIAILFTACDDFYSDAPSTPDIAQPTPANVQEGDPAEILGVAARQAIAAKLGISPDAPRKILFEGETWTERNPGCYPAPSSITGAYLIPGYRLLMQYEGVFYEYDADQGAGTGALCESTFQLIPAEPTGNNVVTADSATPDFDKIHVLRSEDDVTTFNSENSDTATIAVETIEWPEEVLVGGWVNRSPNPEVARAYLSAEGTTIIIEVAVPDDFVDDASDAASQIWELVDITEPDSTYEFVVVG